jgi:hypothetical protein
MAQGVFRRNAGCGRQTTCRPVTVKTDENVEKVRIRVRENRHLGIRMIAEELNMDKETVRQILTTNLSTKIPLTGTQMISVRQFLAGKQIPRLELTPFSPYSVPYDFFHFPKLKSSLRGAHFQSVEDIHKKAAELLKAVSQNDFRRCFVGLKDSYGAVCSFRWKLTLKWISTFFNQSRYLIATPLMFYTPDRYKRDMSGKLYRTLLCIIHITDD